MAVSSFDVFDTCLTRRTAVPSGVFYDVAGRVFSQLGIQDGHPAVEDFVAARIYAEQAARKTSGSEDTTLEEIWQKLIQAMGWPYDESLARCELDAEEESLFPIPVVSERVQAARKQGHRIIFVSDMYLPKEFIRRQLIKHGLAEAADGIYVSGDIGKTKGSGNLFRYLLAQEKVRASQVWHTGDHAQSDYEVPRKLGIHAQLFSEAGLTRAEMSVLQPSPGSCRGGWIAGAMREFRLGGGPEERRDVNELTSQFVAPFVMGFVTWVLQRAQQDGVKRLYFVSRDCQMAWKVARELAPQFGDIDCRYLYISRQALLLPAAAAISPEAMPWMRRSSEIPSLKNLLAKIELTFEEVEPVLGKLAGGQGAQFCLETEQDWRKFWDALNHESIRPRINELIRKRRDTARQFFESVGMFDPVRWSLVDLGWSLSCQHSLRKLLDGWECQNEVRGYYLGLRIERPGRDAAGRSEALFYQPAFDHPQENAAHTVFNQIMLLEHILGCADHPSVHHYEKAEGGKIGPVFVSAINETTLGFSTKLHSEVLDFVKKNKFLVEELKEAACCRETIAALAANFFRFPARKSVNALVGLTVSADQNGLDSQPLVVPMDLRRALLPLIPQLGPFKSIRKGNNCYWQDAAWVITPRTTKRIASLVGHLVGLGARARRVLAG